MAAFKNYYDVLGVSHESTEKELLRGYRKKALSCHPDKNPDNPKAAELFIEVAEALKVLTDKKAKEAFDKVLRAKEASKLRAKAFDAKRKKFKDDLELRENAAQENKHSDIVNAERLAAEVKRLREESSRLLKEQQKIVEKQLAEEREKKINALPKLKVKWKASKTDHFNGGYDEKVLLSFFEKYGDVTAVVVSRKNGLAVIEYAHEMQANLALEFERGLAENPIAVSWLSDTPVSQPPTEVPKTWVANEATDDDFESVVLAKMRKAEEKKQLIEQIKKDDSLT